MTRITTIAAALLFASVSVASAESEGGDSYLKCKAGYGLNAAKTKCVNRLRSDEIRYKNFLFFIILKLL